MSWDRISKVETNNVEWLGLPECLMPFSPSPMTLMLFSSGPMTQQVKTPYSKWEGAEKA